MKNGKGREGKGVKSKRRRERERDEIERREIGTTKKRGKTQKRKQRGPKGV